jgi:hypothetical protein
MEETILSSVPDYKLYKDRAIYVGTFLGGPLAGGYLIAENFKKLGQPEKVKSTWMIAIAVAALLLVVVFLVPGFEKVPPYIIPIFYALAAQGLMKKYQLDALTAHVQKGGNVYSIWRAVLVGLIGCAILVGIVFCLLLAIDSPLLA